VQFFSQHAQPPEHNTRHHQNNLMADMQGTMVRGAVLVPAAAPSNPLSLPRTSATDESFLLSAAAAAAAAAVDHLSVVPPQRRPQAQAILLWREISIAFALDQLLKMAAAAAAAAAFAVVAAAFADLHSDADAA
jgi:hypothetical protein